MAELRLHGRITEDGKLEVELPAGLEPGEIEVTLTIAPENLPWELRPWTEEELREMTTFTPKTGAEIAAMLKSGELDTSEWTKMGITDPVAWVEALRQRERGE